MTFEPMGTGIAPRLPYLLLGALASAGKGKGRSGESKGCLNHTSTSTVSSGCPLAHNTCSVRTEAPVKSPPAERRTQSSLTLVVLVRASKEISTLHLL